MKSWLVVIALLVCRPVFGGQDTILVPADRTAIFPKETALSLVTGVCYTPPNGVTAFWTPKETDLFGIENDLEGYLKKWLSMDKARNERNGENPRWNWTLYYRQIAGVVIGDKKLLFISYYRGHPPAEEAKREKERKEKAARQGLPYTPDPLRWKTKPLYVDDGGYAFFRVVFDLETKAYVWCEQNFSAY